MLSVLAHLTPVTACVAACSRDPFTRAHGRAALRFHLSLAVYFAAIVGVLEVTRGTLVAIQLIPFLLFLNLVLVLNAVLFAIIAIHRAATGQTFTYPLTLGRH
ncbi:DUF4870 domain-containing protein [Solirubrobacter ginsenosidimutans]|uniref:DUF4870 domain-containing protein n=1 Tax=Solirubrobacter ginsenosidimutans TaxID=490573 RepID=A0A9X3N1C5_9ACTN|nr:DUF4870 domain-containing protein [Solirubrobacter ginsenosidimutans]MDA0166614.1 DUF4870 domain-containing protein [Solirubrobacter ginsenosidimutans]